MGFNFFFNDNYNNGILRKKSSSEIKDLKMQTVFCLFGVFKTFFTFLLNIGHLYVSFFNTKFNGQYYKISTYDKLQK